MSNFMPKSHAALRQLEKALLEECDDQAISVKVVFDCNGCRMKIHARPGARRAQTARLTSEALAALVEGEGV